MEEIHHFTSEQKLEWWGYGEWVEEPDEIKFEHAGLKCHVIRCVSRDHGNYPMFGGHLCGFIHVPKDHPWTVKDTQEIDAKVHGGISFGKQFEEGWVYGFDCSHSMDIVPLTFKLIHEMREEFYSKDPSYALKKMIHAEISPVFSQEYRNVKYVIAETKSLAEQARAVYQEKK